MNKKISTYVEAHHALKVSGGPEERKRRTDDLADLVTSARTCAGLTMGEAAAVIHCHMQAWNKWEAGERVMHPGLFQSFILATEIDQ